MKSKIILLAAVLLTVSCSMNPSKDEQSNVTKNASLVQTATGGYNYGEALQKSILFFEFQRAGALPADKRDNWRGDSGLQDEVQGGWYDAGDHVKFNLPMSYTAAMLAWAVYEYGPAFQSSGQLPYIQSALKWTCDYLVGCKNAGWVYQIGDGGLDHAWWGPAEVMQMARPSFKSPATSCVLGESAAALAAASKVLGNASYLSAAKEFYAAAESAKSDSGYTAASGYYNSWSGFYDELVWGALWIYIAGGGETYLTKAETYFDNLGKEGQTTDIAWKWTQSWDDVHLGASLLLAKLTGKAKYRTVIENNLDYWTIGHNGSKIKYTPKGLAWCDTWGSLRYSMNASFLAFVYADWAGADQTRAATVKNFAESQVNYVLGSTGRSYMIGFGTNPPQHPHHRTAHGSWADSQNVPNYHRHTLVGALVGGPDSSDNYNDSISDYTMNEVACDYNAGLVGALAKMYNSYGGTPIANLKAIETPSNLEFFVQTYQNSSSQNLFEIKFNLFNESGWPARALTNNCSFRYFIDISELIAKGYSANDISVAVNYNQDSAGVVTLKQWKGNIYYLNVDWKGLIYPGGQSAYKKEIQVRFAYPTGVANDNSNDFSYQYFNNIVTTGSTNNPNVPVYISGIKVYGNEPGAPGSSSSIAVSSSSSSSKLSSSVSTSSSVITSSSSSSSSSVNMNYTAVPAKIEAENYGAMSGIQTEACGEGTLNVGWVDTGDWLDYGINATSAGDYTIELRVASIVGSGAIDILIDNNKKMTLSVPNTGGWQTYTTVSGTINLSGGNHVLRLYASGSLWNVNWINITKTGASSSSSSSSVTSSSSSSSSVSSSISSSSSSSSSSNGGDYTTITAPFTFDGAGTYRWKIAAVPNFINCWNLSTLTINGVSFLNLYASASQLPAKQDGYYYINYTGLYNWSHIEIK